MLILKKKKSTNYIITSHAQYSVMMHHCSFNNESHQQLHS